MFEVKMKKNDEFIKYDEYLWIDLKDKLKAINNFLFTMDSIQKIFIVLYDAF